MKYIFLFIILCGTAFSAPEAYLMWRANTTSDYLRKTFTPTQNYVLSFNAQGLPVVVPMVANNHVHNADDITTGIMQPSRLGSGTASGTSFLSGAGIWTPVSGDFSVAGGTLSLANTYIEYNPNVADLSDNSLQNPLTLESGYILEGPSIANLPAMTGTTMDISKFGETYTATSSTSLTISGSPTTGQRYSLAINADNNGPWTTGIPEAYDPNTNANITSVATPANGSTYLVYVRESGRWVVFGAPVTSTGYTLATELPSSEAWTDSTTYLYGWDDAALANSSGNYDLTKIQIPKAGTIKRIWIKTSFTAGSNESVTAYVRVNNATDIGTITWTMDGTSPQHITDSSVSYNVIAGDYIALKVVTPAWATNPTACRISGLIYIE